MAYKLTTGDKTVIRLADGAFVPRDPENADYQTFLAWDAVPGNDPLPPDPPAVVYTGQQVWEARVTTSGTTPAELFRRTLAQLTAYTAMVHLVGVDNGNGNVRYIRATAAAKRLSNGAILVNDVGGQPYRVLADHRDGSAGTWLITPTVSGNDFVITVTGAAGRTVNWFVRIEADSFTPGGQP